MKNQKIFEPTNEERNELVRLQSLFEIPAMAAEFNYYIDQLINEGYTHLAPHPSVLALLPNSKPTELRSLFIY